MTEVKDRIELTYRENMAANSIRQMLRSDSRLKASRGMPMEENRLAVSQDDIEAYFHRLVAIVDGTPVCFVFDVGEMSHQEWADREEKTCYAP
jgi:hypothetical protein